MNAPGQVPAIEEDSYTLPGPGRLLRAARESAGVSLRDISAQLHLDERTVDSLECDDFDNLPAPTFVRGYLRGYARLLSVPVGPVLEAYDREGFRPPDLVADISEEPEGKSADFPVSLVTWAVVLVLVAMVVVWWNNNNPELGDVLGPAENDAASSLDSSQATVEAPTSGDSGAFDGNSKVDAPPPEPTASVAIQPPTADPTPAPAPAPMPTQTSQSQSESESESSAPASAVADEPVATDGGAGNRTEEVLAQAREVLTQSRQVIEASSAISAGGSASAQSTPQGATPSAPPPAAETTGDEAAAGGPQSSEADSKVHLVLNFTEDAWVQVLDSDDKRLFYNLAKAGQTIDLRGQAPLRVILGRTRGVEVLVNEQPFDVSPYISKGVARFSLP